MEQTMIKTENVSKRFGSFALQDIHFELPAGYICGLIGENGVGKTTLLNILAGLYEYDGTISIQEKEYRTNQMELQQDIGFVFHEEWFDDWDSLIANSRHYGKYYKNYDETLLKEYLKRFRLDGKKKYKKLSKAEKMSAVNKMVRKVHSTVQGRKAEVCICFCAGASSETVAAR